MPARRNSNFMSDTREVRAQKLISTKVARSKNVQAVRTPGSKYARVPRASKARAGENSEFHHQCKLLKKHPKFGFWGLKTTLDSYARKKGSFWARPQLKSKQEPR